MAAQDKLLSEVHSAAASVLEKGLQLLREQCAAPEPVPVITAGPRSHPLRTPHSGAAAASSRPPSAAVMSTTTNVPDSMTAVASSYEPNIVVQPVNSQTSTPQSALTSAFILLRQTSADLAAEAAAVAATVAEDLAQQHEATLTALNLVGENN